MQEILYINWWKEETHISLFLLQNIYLCFVFDKFNDILFKKLMLTLQPVKNIDNIGTRFIEIQYSKLYNLYKDSCPLIG